MIAIFAILIFSIIILRWDFFKSPGISRFVLIGVFILQVFGGYFSYQYHHVYFAGGDENIYLNGGRQLIGFSNRNPVTYFKLFTNQNRGVKGWEEKYEKIIYWDAIAGSEFIDDNRTAIRINSLVSLVSFNSVTTHIIILIFLSFIGLMALYKTFRKWFKHIYPPAVFLAVFLSPSIIFWTSGILKETHSIFFLGLFLFQLSLFLEQKKITTLLIIISLSVLILLSRTYLAVTLFVPVVFLFITSLFKSNNLLIPISITVIFSIITILLLNESGKDLFQILKAKQVSFNLVGVNANSFFHIPELNRPIDLVIYLPIALLNVYIQPQLYHFGSWLYLFPIIENIDIVTMITMAFWFYKSPNREEKKYLIFILLVWIIGGWIIGLTVPVQGAIARYKSLFIPFLLMSSFAIADWNKLKNKYVNRKHTETN